MEKEKSKLFIGKKDVISESSSNKEEVTKAYNSERSEEQFWNNLRKVDNPNDVKKIYGDKIRQKLFGRNKNKKSNNENKNAAEQEIIPPTIIYPQRNNIFQRPSKKKLSLKYKILIAISILILIAIGVIIYINIRRPPETIRGNEKFVTGLTYKENQIMRFQNIKQTKIVFDFGNMSVANNTKILKEYSDYIIGINKRDKVVENQTEKEIFQGFIFLENYMIDNKTNKMLLQNSSLFDNILEKKKNLRGLQEKKEKKYFNFSLDEIESYGCIDNGTLPIMKFIFYRNGKIKRIFRPNNLTTLLYNSMTQLLEKVIPKITEDYFNKSYNNISEGLEAKYKKIKNNTIEEEEEEEEEDEEENEFEEENSENSENEEEKEETEKVKEERSNRLLIEKNKTTKKIKVKRLNNRRMENNNGNETLNHEEIEQIIDQEYDEENEFNLNLFNNELTEGKKSSNNNTNLNFYSHTKVRNDYAEFKGSQQNTTINSIINENEKALKEVHYSHQGRLVNDTDFKEELDKDKMKSCSNENLIDCNDVANDSEENIINSQIKGMNYEIIEDIISTRNFIDNKKKVISKLEEIFKNYENNSEIIQIEEKTSPDKRLLQHLTDYALANKFEYKDVEIEIEKGNEIRRMDEYSGYYGMKNMEYAKILFSLNLLGIQSKFQVKNILYVNNGLSVVKIVFQLAFIKISFTLKKVHTNMHLAIRNYNEMGLTEIYLINESNLKLQNRNEYYTNAIVNLEKNFTNLLINKYDFSNIFKESFTDMYETIKSFTSEIYQELIQVIRNSYDNYTQIMNDVENNKHKVFEQIRIITKNEYIDFIKKMLILV